MSGAAAQDRLPPDLQSLLDECATEWADGAGDAELRRLSAEHTLPAAFADNEELQATFLDAVNTMVSGVQDALEDWDEEVWLEDWDEGRRLEEELASARAEALPALDCAERLVDIALDLVPTSESFVLANAQLRTAHIPARRDLGPAEALRRSVTRADEYLSDVFGVEPEQRFAAMVYFRYPLSQRLAVAEDTGCDGEECDLFLVAAEESVRIARDSVSLAREVPNTPDVDRIVTAQDVLVRYLAGLARVRLVRGEMAEALTAYEESLAIARDIAANHPDAPEHQLRVTAALERIGNARRMLGDLDGGPSSQASQP